MTSCTVYAYAERFLLHYGFTADRIGVILAVAYLAAMLLQPVLAQEADRERLLTLRSGISICAFAAMLLAPAIPLFRRALPLLAVLFGVMSSVTLAVQPLVNAVGFHYINRGEAVDFSFARGAGSVAYALASLILGALAAWRIDSVLWFNAAANLALFLTALWFAPHRTGMRTVKPSGSVFSVLRKYPKLLLFCVGMLILNVPHVLINSYLASITKVIGGDMSIMIAIAALVEFPAMTAYSHIRKRTGDRVPLVVASCFYLIKTGLLLLAALKVLGTWAVYASFATQMLSYAIFTPASGFFANAEVSPEDQVKGQMLLTETILFSGMISMLLGGLSVERLGVPMTLLLAEGFVLVGILPVSVAVLKKDPDQF